MCTPFKVMNILHYIIHEYNILCILYLYLFSFRRKLSFVARDRTKKVRISRNLLSLCQFVDWLKSLQEMWVRKRMNRARPLADERIHIQIIQLKIKSRHHFSMPYKTKYEKKVDTIPISFEKKVVTIQIKYEKKADNKLLKKHDCNKRNN